jgi:hypothetical protein
MRRCGTIADRLAHNHRAESILTCIDRRCADAPTGGKDRMQDFQELVDNIITVNTVRTPLDRDRDTVEACSLILGRPV